MSPPRTTAYPAMDGLTKWLVRQVEAGLQRNGWSQRDLAKRVGLSETQLSAMLRGRKPGKVGTWDRLLVALGYRL